ncbi:MAG: hypothetical protein AABN34_02360 [Acidobacteriota bacterium]
MLFRQSEKKNSDEGLLKLPSRTPRLHSVPARLRGRQFKGSFEVGGSSYELTYAPARASVAGRRLQLQGRLTVKDSRGQTRTGERVRATVVGTQGGIGTAPPRRQEHTSVATATPQLPEVESTGPASFCGVMYIHFEPLAGSALGVAADLSRVQLNARLGPVNDSERALQGAYSSIVDALYGKKVDASAAAVETSELNKLLAEN